MLNEVRFIGRIANDLELITSENNIDRCTFSLAVETAYSTDFPRITVFGKKAKNLVKYNNKGDLIFVDGYISTKKVEKEEVKYYENIVANHISYLSHKKSKEDQKDVFENSEEKEENKDESEPEKTLNYEKQKATGFQDEDLPF